MKKIKKILNFLNTTPFHPQWLIFRNERQRFEAIGKIANGYVLDIGCSQQTLKQFLPDKCTYVGLDYPDTADSMYQTRPVLYGDAQKLPFSDNTFETISFLEVLEHLPNPQEAVKESYRVLKPGGTLIFSMPFLYPIHDAPFDFQRLTIHGLKQLFTHNNFTITQTDPSGSPLTTAALLSNIALVKTVLNAFRRWHPAALIILALPILIPLINLLGWMSDVIGPHDNFMPHGYTLHLTKVLT